MVEHGVYAGVRERETPQPLRVSTASVSLGGHGASTAAQQEGISPRSSLYSTHARRQEGGIYSPPLPTPSCVSSRNRREGPGCGLTRQYDDED